MSIATEITRINTNIANAYTQCNNKGATMPQTQDSANLATCISSIPASTSPTLATLTVTPSTTAQTLTPSSGTDGYNTVSVSAVTASIDSDIVASNIKSGCNILGVNGSVTELAGETRTVSITSTSGNTFTPSSGKNGITSIKVNPTNKNLTITPTTTSQTFTVPSNYSGYGTVTCNAGTTPTGTYTITANGTYDITNYASADVSVASSSGNAVAFYAFPSENNCLYLSKLPTSTMNYSYYKSELLAEWSSDGGFFNWFMKYNGNIYPDGTNKNSYCMVYGNGDGTFGALANFGSNNLTINTLINDSSKNILI